MCHTDSSAFECDLAGASAANWAHTTETSATKQLEAALKAFGMKLVNGRRREKTTFIILFAALMLPSIQAGKFFLYSSSWGDDGILV